MATKRMRKGLKRRTMRRKTRSRTRSMRGGDKYDDDILGLLVHHEYDFNNAYNDIVASTLLTDDDKQHMLAFFNTYYTNMQLSIEHLPGKSYKDIHAEIQKSTSLTPDQKVVISAMVQNQMGIDIETEIDDYLWSNTNSNNINDLEKKISKSKIITAKQKEAALAILDSKRKAREHAHTEALEERSEKEKRLKLVTKFTDEMIPLSPVNKSANQLRNMDYSEPYIKQLVIENLKSTNSILPKSHKFLLDYVTRPYHILSKNLNKEDTDLIEGFERYVRQNP